MVKTPALLILSELTDKQLKVQYISCIMDVYKILNTINDKHYGSTFDELYEMSNERLLLILAKLKYITEIMQIYIDAGMIDASDYRETFNNLTQKPINDLVTILEQLKTNISTWI